ncbi:hypothetical protein J4417_04470 [Candidatus Woesearchaeota archaeon]|nr:hypothetical protein [Candidatus Woesearchaeota archaeon]
MDSDLDEETERLFKIVLDNADKFQTANPYLFQDLAQGLPYAVLGSGIKDEGLARTFDYIFEGLGLKDRNFLGQLKDRAGEGTAARALLDSLIHHQLSLYLRD